jgi:hypothetical protein
MSILFESHTEELTDFVFNDEVITNFGSVVITTTEFPYQEQKESE